VTSALTRRTRWLLVAGAVVVALLVNVAWVAFGPGEGNKGREIESAIRQAWSDTGHTPRTVTCSESDAVWTCDIQSMGGQVVHCPVGGASAFFANPKAALRTSCRVE
jgi:hypothetical protein